MYKIAFFAVLLALLFGKNTANAGNFHWGFGISSGGQWSAGVWNRGHGPYPYGAPGLYFPYYPYPGFFSGWGLRYEPPPNMRSNWATYAQGRDDGFLLGYEDGQRNSWKEIIRNCPDEYCLGFKEGYRQGFSAARQERQ